LIIGTSFSDLTTTTLAQTIIGESPQLQ